LEVETAMLYEFAVMQNLFSYSWNLSSESAPHHLHSKVFGC
jgi:hypothetical protein